MLRDPVRVLVVDDHPGQRELLRAMLGALGVGEVLEAASGNEAVLRLQAPELPVDLVLSDVHMSDGDGFDVLRAVLALPRPPRLALVSAVDHAVLASVARLHDPDERLKLSTIAKPVSMERLRELIATLGSAQARPAAAVMAIEDIERGLAAGEFTTFLEPQVELRSGRVCGFEALARWRHPQRGLLAPVAFIPALQSSTLMSPFTVALFERLLGIRAELQAAGFTGRLSLNVGAECLDDPEFPGRLQALLQRHGLADGRGITLELTESTAIADPVAGIAALARLRLLGFELAIDDFGIGHSSLANMQNAAFSEIKIDRQFTSQMLTDRISRAAVESIIQMARGLGWACVAEGIETEAIRRALASMGCPGGQGWLFSRPIDPREVVAWWQQWRGDAAGQPDHEAAGQMPPPARRGSEPMLDASLLAQLEQRDVPSWVFDLDDFRMRWANAAALRLWQAPSLAALIERDFSGDLSAAARERLIAYRSRLAGGRVITEPWTVYPLGRPVSLDGLVSGVRLPDGHHGMPVEAFRSGALVGSSVFEVEAAVATPTPLLLMSADGAIVWRNAAATLAFGSRSASFAELFADPAQAEALLAEARTRREGQADAVLGGDDGEQHYRLRLRDARDPQSGAALLVASLMPVSDLLQAPSPTPS